jgi:hypothetical protein
MSFKPGLEEVGKIFGLKQWERRRRLFAIILILVLVIGIVGIYMYIYRLGPFKGIPYTGAATLVLQPRPATGLAVTADEYLGPISYYVIDPTDNTTIESGSITAADDWEVEVSIPSGHPGYVYVAMIPPNNTYYLYKPLSDTSVIINNIKHYKITIDSSKVVLRAEFIKAGTLTVISEGDVTFSASIFTTNILFNLSAESALYNATLKISFNVSNIVIDAITLNGSTITWYHDDTDKDGYYDSGENIYIWISGQTFLANLDDDAVDYVLAITFSNISITSGQVIKATMEFYHYKFDPDMPYSFDEMVKVTLATATAYYTRA